MDDVMEKKFRDWYVGITIYAIVLGLVAFVLESPSEIARGCLKIAVSKGVLITDYIALSSIGSAFMNVSIVTLLTVALLFYNDIPMDGSSIATIGLMSGFSFFGKNFFNMWFILLGTYVYCLYKKQPFKQYVKVGLISTSLAPIISSTFFYNNVYAEGVVVSIICGLVIGFIMPMLAEHTDRLLHNLSLYNGGFAVGLLAMMMVPMLKSMGFSFNTVLYWSSGNNPLLSSWIYGLCGILIILGFLSDGKEAFWEYLKVLCRTGHPKEDFITLHNSGAVLINIGVNGIIGTSFILLTGGELNGPTIGGILAVMGFGARGKHAFNIIPVMLGVFVAGFSKSWSITDPAAQIALMFCTTLAPIAGFYGVIPGFMAGYVHASVVQYAGLGYSGVNLYNNGFAGGIVSIVFFSVLSNFVIPRSYPINAIIKQVLKKYGRFTEIDS